MRLTDASVAIRPRSAWEALDLGILLARRHAGVLMASWAIVTLPVFVLLSVLLWNYSSWAVLLFWWLKPAFERLPLYILSRSLFGDTPTLKEALRAFPGLLKPQLLPSLLWRRLSPTRSFDLPVLQLEGLAGPARSQRLVVLGQRNAGGATWLTIVGMHFELALWLGLSALMYLMLPQQWVEDWKWQSLISVAQGDWAWLEHVSNLIYALLLIVWEPVYVACGFTLYLNRRTELEAWDIELVFRRLRQRLIGSAYALLLVVAGAFALLPSNDALAAGSETASTASQSCPLPDQNPDGPQGARLIQQKLNSEDSRSAAEKILAAPPFKNSEKVTRWRLHDDKKEQKPADPDEAKRLKRFFEALGNWKAFKFAAQGIEVLLWGVLFTLIALRSSGAIASGCGCSSGASACRRSPVARPPACCSGWSWRRKPCPATSPAKPSAYGTNSPAPPSACSTAPCSAACCTISACHCAIPPPKAKCWRAWPTSMTHRWTTSPAA